MAPVDEHHYVAFHYLAVALRLITTAASTSSFGIDYQVAPLQKLIGHLHGCLHIATAVLLEVEHQALHALCTQTVQSVDKLLMGGGPEVADADIAHAGPDHVRGIDRLHGNLVTGNGEREAVVNAEAHHPEHHLRALLAAQAAHHLLLGHLHTGNRRIVHTDNAVASQDAHLLRGAVGHGLDNQ